MSFFTISSEEFIPGYHVDDGSSLELSKRGESQDEIYSVSISDLRYAEPPKESSLPDIILVSFFRKIYCIMEYF